MKLRKAIEKAKKAKCKIKNDKLKQPMRNQSAKSLIYWLISDTKSNPEVRRLVTTWLNSDGWRLDK